MTGRTFIIDPTVQGRVSVVTERPLSRSEYFELFLSTMRANGFVAVPVAGGALRIQPVAGASAGAPIGRRASPSSFVTEILRVRNIEAAAAVETLRPLVSRDGTLTASRSSIVVSDFADNVARVRQVLARIDVDSGVTRIVGLDNAGAREIAGALGELAPEGVSVVPVDSSNAHRLPGRRGGGQPADRDRAGARPARGERQRDPGRLPRTCRCRAIAAGAPAGARPDGDPADAAARPRAAAGRARPAGAAMPGCPPRLRPKPPPAPPRSRPRPPSPAPARSARATRSSPASRAPMRSSSRRAPTSSARWAS